MEFIYLSIYLHGWTCSSGTCTSPRVHRASASQNASTSQARRTFTTHDQTVPLALAHAYCHHNTTPARIHQTQSHSTPLTRPRRFAALCSPFYCESLCQCPCARHHPFCVPPPTFAPRTSPAFRTPAPSSRRFTSAMLIFQVSTIVCHSTLHLQRLFGTKYGQKEEVRISPS